MNDTREPGPDAVVLREATVEDLAAVVALLADDVLGAQREEAGTSAEPGYRVAFEAILADRNQVLLVADEDGAPVGVLQLTFIPGLTYRGGLRAQVEGVRVARSHRGLGLGRAMMEEVVRRARARGCVLVQLTTDRRRPEAVSFYEGLGFAGSHVGMKLHLRG